MPPHRITYIVVFRRDYASTWLDFQQDELAGRTPTMMSLRLFNEEQAREIIAVITEAAKFTVDKELVDDLIASMKNDEARISPVDIGITLLALNERALGKPRRHLAKGDYQIAGGATGLLADYISSRLDRYREDERITILKAMLGLADLGNDQRLAQGLPPDQLADKVGLPAATMQRYLHDLASPQQRLLEVLSPSGAYRLSHERLIPALRQLSSLVLAEAEQTGRMFNRAYGDWVSGRRSHKLLLGGRRLRDVVKYRTQFYWGAARADKATFLKRSLTWRNWQRGIADALKELKGLISLTLSLAGGSVSSLDALEDLKGLTSLTLNLIVSNIDLSSLRRLDKLETLKIYSPLRYELNALPRLLTRLHLSDKSEFY